MQAELHLSFFNRINELETEVRKCHHSLNRATDEQKVNEKEENGGGGYNDVRYIDLPKISLLHPISVCRSDFFYYTDVTEIRFSAYRNFSKSSIFLIVRARLNGTETFPPNQA